MPFGYYFSYFVVVSRCVLATVWLGLVYARPITSITSGG
jgi:cytosine/uracil/thiamine/allantoin permease